MTQNAPTASPAALEAEIERLRAALKEETECARQTDDVLAKTEADNERLLAQLNQAADGYAETFNQGKVLQAEVERLTALQIATAARAEMAQIDNERLNKQGSDLAAIIRQQGFEIDRLRAALQEIAGNKTNSRAWLEDKARRALKPEP